MASDKVNSPSALTATFEGYVPVKDDRFVFTVANSDATIRFTDADLACKETGMAVIEIAEDNLSMTMIVGDAAGVVPKELICTFDIYTPKTGTVTSSTTWKLNDGATGEVVLPAFFEYFNAGFFVHLNKPAKESLYTFTIPSTVEVQTGSAIKYQYMNDYYDALSAYDVCTDAEKNEHDFRGDAALDNFSIIIGDKLMAPVDGQYTFECYLTNPAQIPDPIERPYLHVEVDQIHRSQNIYLPTLTDAKIKTVSMTYGSAKAKAVTELRIIIDADGVATSDVDTITFTTTPAFKFEPTSICSYNDGSDIMKIQTFPDHFEVILPAGLTLKNFAMVCTGASAPAHDAATATMKYFSPNGYGTSQITFNLPPMYDNLPITMTFTTDETHPDTAATHTYSFYFEETYDYATFLYMNITSVISSTPACSGTQGENKFTPAFDGGYLSVPFAAKQIEPYQNIVITCHVNNRKTAYAYPEVKSDLVNVDTMKVISSTTIPTANFQWEMMQYNAQVLQFEVDDHKINADYIRFILGAYESVHGIFRSDMVVIGLTETADDLSQFRIRGTDYEYSMTIAFKTLSLAQLDAKRDNVREKLKKKLDDVSVLKAAAKEYPKHCTDAKISNDETDVDCGGSCAGCATNQHCHEDDDCLHGYCKKPFYMCENSAATAALWVAALTVVAALFF